MTAKNSQKQGRILEGGGEISWLARIYTPVRNTPVFQYKLMFLHKTCITITIDYSAFTLFCNSILPFFANFSIVGLHNVKYTLRFQYCFALLRYGQS